jgi:hypothetical protein
MALSVYFMLAVEAVVRKTRTFCILFDMTCLLVIFMSRVVFRINQQQCKSAGSLVMYHFVGNSASSSADPTLMIRRLTAQVPNNEKS